MNRTERLGQEKISKLLWQFSLPAMVAMSVTALYNVIDSIFVGQGVGADALTAVAVAFPVMMIQMGLVLLIGIGATSLISLRLGEGQLDEAEALLGNAFVLLILAGLAFPAVVLAVLEPMLVLLGAQGQVLAYAKTFITVIMLGNLFLYVGFGLNHIIRAEGNPSLAMKTMVLSALINMVLNPLFIFGFQWGIAGSGGATVVSEVITGCWVLSYFVRGHSHLKLRSKNFRLQWQRLKAITAIGLSPFLLQVAASVVTFFYNQVLLVYGGPMAVAAMGIINRIAMFVLMPVFGINQAVQPLIGYNYGARKWERVREALKLAIYGATLLCTLGFAAVQLAGDAILRMFTAEQELLLIGIAGIQTVMFMFPIVGFQIVGGNYFQAVGKASYTILFSMSRQVLLLIPFIWLLPQYFGLPGIWLAAPTADLLSAILTGAFLWREWHKLK